MTKEVDISADGKDGAVTATGSISGSPEKGGNLNNTFEVSVNSNKRVTASGGGGFTLEHGFSDGVKVIGSAGVSASIAGNVGVSAEQSQRQHDSSIDSPVRPHAIGMFEMHDILKEVVDKTGGDLGKFTLLQSKDLIEQHPNLLKPQDFATFENFVQKLDTTNVTLAPEIATGQEAIASLHTDVLQNGALSTNPKITGAVDALYDASLNIPPALSKPYTVDGPLLSLHLSDVNSAATLVKDFIASKGGAAAIGSNLTQAADGFVAEASHQHLPANAATDIQNVLTKIGADIPAAQNFIASKGGAAEIAGKLTNSTTALAGDVHIPTLPANTASDITSLVGKISHDVNQVTDIYSQRPTAKEVRNYFHETDRAVAIDPRIDAAAFAAVGVMTPTAKAAVMAQESVAAGVANVDVILGDKVEFHPAIARTLRGEVGIGSESLSVSPGMGRKLNLALSDTNTQMGGYVYAQQDKLLWTGIDGERTITTVGVGASISKPIGNHTVGFVNAEAQAVHIDDIGPGNIPGKSTNSGIAITGGIRF